MGRRLLFVALVLIACDGCSIKKPAVEVQPAQGITEPSPAATDFSEQSTWLLGYFNQTQLKQAPYSEWFSKGHDDYTPDQNAISKLKSADTEQLSITIVLGTWCPDSRREVPRFMKIIDQWQFPPEKITFIGVDNEKIAPVGGFDMLDIVRVPTFIIYKNKVEAGRIIENPVTSLEQDLSEILTRNE